MKSKLRIRRFGNLAELMQSTKGIKLVLFGNTHGFLNDVQTQGTLIAAFKPKYYLYELLENRNITSDIEFRRYLSEPNSKNFSVISKFGELKPVIRMARRYKLKIIGCDIKNMGRRNREFLSNTGFTKKEKNFEKSLMNRREEQHARIINNYVSKTNNPVFASVGAYHLRKSSKTLSNLKTRDYIMCYPTYKGRQISGAAKGMNKKNVAYLVKLNRH